MSELTPVLESFLAELDAGRSVSLCSVVATRGSTPQSAGATMLLRSDFSTQGTLGGGCVEAEVKRRAFELLQAGDSELLDFVLDHDYGWDDGLICGGRMDIAVASFSPGQDVGAFREALDLMRRRRSASIPLIVSHDGRQRLYRVRLELPPTLLIAGAGHVGQAVAKLAIDLDFHVVVIDDRADMAHRNRFDERVELRVGDIAEVLGGYPIDPQCYVVIVTRGHQNDEQALEAVIRSDATYVGLIGSKRKARLIFEDLRQGGISEALLSRVRTPIGLEIGAVLVSEIAVSIAGELVAHRRRSTALMVEGPVDVADSSVV